MAPDKETTRESPRHHSQRITVLLPSRLNSHFKDIFEDCGFSVIWAPTQSELERIVESSDIDLAIEWQHGERDFPIRDLLRRRKKKTVVLLALNYRREAPPDLRDLGYADVLPVPFKLTQLPNKFHSVLPLERKRVVERMLFYWRCMRVYEDE